MDDYLKERMKNEAIRRLELFEVLTDVVDCFDKSNQIYYSERVSASYQAALFWLNNKPDWAEKIKKLEEKHNILVYHAVFYHMEWGDMLDLIYVGSEEDRWEEEYDDLKDGYAHIFYINLPGEKISGGYGVYEPAMGGFRKVE